MQFSQINSSVKEKPCSRSVEYLGFQPAQEIFIPHYQATKAQASLCICTSLPESSLLAYLIYGYRCHSHQKLDLAPLDTSTWHLLEAFGRYAPADLGLQCFHIIGKQYKGQLNLLDLKICGA